MVTNTLQQRISKIRLGAASAALTLVGVLGLGVVTTHSAQAQTFTVLYSFTGSSDGGTPLAGVIRDGAGTLYGTTYSGGASNLGTVFKISSSGIETVWHSFSGGTTDGENPAAGVVRDALGDVYGTTEAGGASNYGTVYKIDSSGTENVVYSFIGGTTDGCNPEGGLTPDKAGNLYGTTFNCGAYGYGTVYKIDTSGTETVVHSFKGGSSDGAYPYFAGLLMDISGKIYGVTENGGTANEGVVYYVDNSGTSHVVHSFTGTGEDGCYAFGTPARNKKGNLYGTTMGCGSGSLGIVWEVSKSGAETVLHTFVGGATDGELPLAGVVLGQKGNLYGDTYQGGASTDGTVYKLNKKGKETLLHSFTGSEGASPVDGLWLDPDGYLYGTASKGGSGGAGTVFKLRQ